MKRGFDRAVLAAVAGSFAVLLVGCETLGELGTPTLAAYDEAAETATRIRVVAELQEAQRLGLVTVGEDGIAWATEEQNARIARAGDAAVRQMVAGKAK